MYSSYQQGQAAKQQGKYNAQVARINQQATRDQTDMDMAVTREKYRRARGAQMNAAARSGLDIGGSLSDLVFDTNQQESREIMTSLYKAGVMVTQQENNRALSLAQGRQGATAGYYGMAGALASGVAGGIANYPTIND